MKTCGDFGGVKNDGGPCGRRVKDGRCRDHNDDAAATLQAEKSEVLALLADGTNSLVHVSRSVGRDPATIWRWRKADPAFDEAVAEALDDGEKVKVSLVEDSLFHRIVKGEASGTETIFWLQNRAPDRWKDKRHHEHSGPGGGPIETKQTVDLSRLDTGDLKLLKQLQARASATSEASGGNGSGP